MKFMETVDHTASITKSMETTSNILDVVNEVEIIKKGINGMNILDQRLAWVNSLRLYEYGSEMYNSSLAKLADSINKELSESLMQLVVQGPVDAGDIISTDAKNKLIQLYLATPVVYKGEEGYTCATYLGGRVYDEIVRQNNRTVTINITGPAGSGKTIISNKIAEMLRTEFNATVIPSGDMEADDAGKPAYPLANWEVSLVGKSTWKLIETIKYRE